MKIYLDVIKEVMPKNAEIRKIKSDDLIYSIDWPLNNDEARPNKRSKTIAVKISMEANMDFEAKPESMRETALDRFSKILSNNLAAFEPDHNNPVNTPNPVVEWVVTTTQLMS
jgi:hypothetical protein